MNQDQQVMLSVKSAIERTIAALISTYQPFSDSKSFFHDVERYMAALFASEQIEKGFTVEHTSKGDINVSFCVRGHYSTVHYLLPSQLKWVDPKAPPAEVTKADDILAKLRAKVAASKAPPPAPVVAPNNQLVNDAVPQLAEILDQYVDRSNDAVFREQLKARLVREAKLLVPSAHHIFATCDETNNPQFEREQGETNISVEFIFSGDENEYVVDMKLRKPRPVSKSDPIVVAAVGSIIATIDGMKYDTIEELLELITRSLTERNKAHDFKVDGQILWLPTDPTVFKVEINLNIQPYEDSDWIMYPIVHNVDVDQ